MKFYITTVLICIIICTQSIYTYQLTTVNDETITLSRYSGKKMLLVNIASENPLAAVQIPQLERLSQLFRNDLVVIGFPSNDFGNEPRSNYELKLLMQNTYQTHFPLSSLIGVKDSTGHLSPIYKWLHYKNENGVIDLRITKDFQKILIDNEGTIIGFFWFWCFAYGYYHPKCYQE